jgi:hypothetical protein
MQICAYILPDQMLDGGTKRYSGSFMNTIRAVDFVGKHCHLDHDHKVNCVSQSPGFQDWETHDKQCARKFEELVRDFALNPSHPLTSTEGFLDLLALTITANGNALLKHRMKTSSPCGASSGAEISAEYATRLLRYALNKHSLTMSICSLAVSDVEGVPAPNFEALTLLLRLGGCPETQVDGASAWERFLDNVLSRILLQKTCIPVHLWALRVLRILIQQGVCQNVNRMWAEHSGLRMKSTEDSFPTKYGVIEYRRYSAVQVVYQIADSLQSQCEAELTPNHHASEVKQLDKWSDYLYGRDNNRKCGWRGLGKRSMNAAHWKTNRALVIAHQTRCDIAEYQQVDISDGSRKSDIVTWIPGGCCKMRELLNNSDEQWGVRPTLQEDQPRFDVIGWLVFEE